MSGMLGSRELTRSSSCVNYEVCNQIPRDFHQDEILSPDDVEMLTDE